MAKAKTKAQRIFEPLPKIKDQHVLRELKRAHLLIALLSLSLISVLAINLDPSYQANATLTYIAIILLAILGLISLLVNVALSKNKK